MNQKHQKLHPPHTPINWTNPADPTALQLHDRHPILLPTPLIFSLCAQARLAYRLGLLLSLAALLLGLLVAQVLVLLLLLAQLTPQRDDVRDLGGAVWNGVQPYLPKGKSVDDREEFRNVILEACYP